MFTDKVIIVTGAAGNVGSAVTRLLASRGAKVAAVDTLGPPLTAVMATLENPSRHLPIPEVDLTDPTACDSLVARVVHTLGGLHGVATTVGGFAMGKLAETSLDQWDAMFSLNVKTTWNIYRAAAPVLKSGGRRQPRRHRQRRRFAWRQPDGTLRGDQKRSDAPDRKPRRRTPT